MECYDPKTNKWTFCSPMSEARDLVATGVLNGYIYVIGEPVISAERWAKGERISWSSYYVLKILTSASPAWISWTAICDKQYIYVYGNLFCLFWKDFFFLHRYDPKTDKWTTIAPMNDGRDDVGLGVLGNRLFALSNDIEYRDWRTTQSSFEAYDPALNEWQEVNFAITFKLIFLF